ncbi:MAG: hypothetical protein E7060_01265 [Treponema bryantii]|nr:hypothetical protein [Treponema bryantii]
MKKSNLFLSVLCIFFCFVASSCNLAEVFDVDETKNEWYYQPFEYQTDNGILYLDCYLLYTDGDYNPSKSFNEEIKEKMKDQSGLHIVVVPAFENENKTILEQFFDTESSYFLLNIPKNSRASDFVSESDNGEESNVGLNKVTINDNLWAYLYNFCLTGETDTPDVLKSSSDAKNVWSLSTKKISIKKILAGLLLNYIQDLEE